MVTCFVLFSSHVERLETDWVVDGRSILDRRTGQDSDQEDGTGGTGGTDGNTFFAQRRIGLSNFKRFQQPSTHHDVGLHIFERTVKSGLAFRAHMVQEGQLTAAEDRELASLERSMEACHPILDGVIFLG